MALDPELRAAIRAYAERNVADSPPLSDETKERLRRALSRTTLEDVEAAS